MDKANYSASRHFKLQSLADGVFAAIAENGGWGICNAGLVDLGGQVLAFDALLSPQAALDLQRCSGDIFGRTPQIVIDSHYHNDHIWGNQVFSAEAQIISSTRTRELIATEGMEELRWYSANAAQQLKSLQARYHETDNEQQKSEMLLFVGEYEGVVEALPYLKVTLPSITFEGQLVINGEKRTARLMNFTDGHSGSDTVLYLPQDGIVFMSDLLFVGFHPYLLDGNPRMLLNTLRELSQLQANCYVPGHGEVGTTEDVELLIAYLEHCFETAQLLVDAGDPTEEKVKELAIAEKFQAWHLPQFYRRNIQFICENRPRF